MTKRKTRRGKKWGVGFIDLCRVDDHGEIHCNDSPKVRAKFGVERYLPVDKDKRKCVQWKSSALKKKKKAAADCERWHYTEHWSKDVEGKDGPRTRKVGGKWGSKQGAPFFSSTSKVHAPTFGIPPAGSCPAVQTPVLNWLKDAVKDPKLQKPDEMMKRLLKEVPRKCLACYATSGNYAYAETQ